MSSETAIRSNSIAIVLQSLREAGGLRQNSLYRASLLRSNLGSALIAPTLSVPWTHRRDCWPPTVGRRSPAQSAWLSTTGWQPTELANALAHAIGFNSEGVAAERLDQDAR